jgi:hypothetical protein
MPESLSGTEYQLQKFIKHTTPTGIDSVNSVFADPSFATYSGYVVATVASGCVQIDDGGRSNVLWAAGEEVGCTYRSGVFSTTASGVKVVLHHDEFRIHAFPAGASELGAQACRRCGRQVPEI